MSETILVTGACGFTGSNMIEYLAETSPDAKVVATDLPGSRRDEYYVQATESDDPQPVQYREFLEQFDIEFLPGDLTKGTDVEAVVTAHEYDTVFHTASLFDYFAPREALYAVNVDGTRNLLSALAQQDRTPRLVHWSTLGVLGDAGFERPKTEDDNYYPENRYCESKVVQEQVVLSFENRIDVTIVRPGPIYGPRHHYGVYNMLSVIEQFRAGPLFLIYPRRYQRWFPSIHVDDVVRAADYLAGRPEAVGETYNLLSDPIRTDEMTRILCEELSRPAVPIPLPDPIYRAGARLGYRLFCYWEKRARERERRPLIEAQTIQYLTANMWFSNQKLKDSGYELRYEDPRDGLRDYVQWCLDNGYFDSQEERSSPVERIGQAVREQLN